MAKSVFIYYPSVEEAFVINFQDFFRKNGFNSFFETTQNLAVIPRGHSAYVLHPYNVNAADLRKLRAEETGPIIGLVLPSFELPVESRDCYDSRWAFVDDFSELIRNVNSGRRVR